MVLKQFFIINPQPLHRPRTGCQQFRRGLVQRDEYGLLVAPYHPLATVAGEGGVCPAFKHHPIVQPSHGQCQ